MWLFCHGRAFARLSCGRDGGMMSTIISRNTTIPTKAHESYTTFADNQTGVEVNVFQGERDYQVTMEDFAGWKKALAGRKTATLKSYPKLNHLFMGGLGKAKPDEYMKTNHVAKEVIDDIAAWIEKR